MVPDGLLCSHRNTPRARTWSGRSRSSWGTWCAPPGPAAAGSPTWHRWIRKVTAAPGLGVLTPILLRIPEILLRIQGAAT